MREPQVRTCPIAVICKDFSAQQPGITFVRTTMVMSAEAGDDDGQITVPGVRFNPTDYVAHDDEGYHVWRYDSRRWRTRG